MSTDKKKLDDLLRRAENAKAAADLPAGKGTPVVTPPPTKTPANTNVEGEAQPADPSVTENIATIADGMRKTGKTLGDAKEAIGGFWDRVKPVVDFIAAPIKWVAGVWGGIWNKHAYTTDKETGERHLSRNRAGAILSATFLAAVALTPTVPGEMIRDWTVDPVIDAPIMLVTRNHDTLYNARVQEVSPDVYRLQGCFSQVCTPENTATFNIEGRVSHGMWQLLDKGNPFFVPDRVAAAVPNSANKCEIDSYSVRARISKYVPIFPQVLDIECVATGAPLPVAPAGP